MKRLKLLSWLVLPAVILALARAATPAPDAPKPKTTAAPAGAKVYIVSPTNGAIVDKSFKVIFGLSGNMGISPAGVVLSDGTPPPNTGHHHLLVDVAQLPTATEPLPQDKPGQVIHFGKGQTETTLDLPAGKHTLQLEFATYAHVPFDPPLVSEKITVTVRP